MKRARSSNIWFAYIKLIRNIYEIVLLNDLLEWSSQGMMSLLPQMFVGFEICGIVRDGRRDFFHLRTPFGSQT